MSSPLWKYSLAAAALVLALNVNAHAQVCGDADNSGAVTVTDGVQTLRAAAGLDSSCTNATCDVDGSGAVTVTDGVNVLRKAAGIAITEACGGGGVNAQVQELLQSTVPIFGGLTKFGTTAQAAGSTNPCENDGSVTAEQIDDDTIEVTFDFCDIEGIEYDGTVDLTQSTSTLTFSIDFTDLATDNSFSFDGDLQLLASGNNVAIAGNLDVFFDDLGDIAVTFDNIVSNPDGIFISGALQFDAVDSDIDGVSAIRVGFTGTTISPVTVTLADQTQLGFTFDSTSGVLTPASN